jgi:hypothetical protein
MQASRRRLLELVFRATRARVDKELSDRVPLRPVSQLDVPVASEKRASTFTGHGSARQGLVSKGSPDLTRRRFLLCQASAGRLVVLQGGWFNQQRACSSLISP